MRAIFHIETTFVSKPPCKLAGMITLGKKIAGVTKLGKEQNEQKKRVGVFLKLITHQQLVDFE